MKKAIYFLIALMSALPYYGQNQQVIDSLLQVLETDVSDRERVDTYVLLADEYDLQDSVHTRIYLNKAVGLASSIGYIEGEIDALQVEGKMEIFFLEDYERARILSLKIFELSHENGYLRGEARARLKFGLIEYRTNSFFKSLENYYEAIRIARIIDDDHVLSTCYNNIGLIYYYLEDYEKSLRFFKYFQEVQEKLRNVSSLSLAYNNVSTSLMKLGEYDKATYYAKEAIHLASRQKNLRTLGMSYQTLGQVYYANGYLDSAEISLIASLAYWDSLGLASRKDFVTLGLVYSDQGKDTKALEYIKRGLNLALEYKIAQYARDGAYSLYQLEEKLGNHEAALDAYLLYKQKDDSLKNQKLVYNLSEFEFQQEKDSIRFASEKEKLAVAQVLDRQQNTILITIIVVFFLFIVLVILYRFYKLKIRSNKSIKANFESLQELTAIGRDITSSLSTESIIEKVYHSLVGIVPADSVYFGYLNVDQNRLEFPGSIENGKISKPFSYDLDHDLHSLSVICFKDVRPIKTNDIESEFSNYRNPRPVEEPKSAIVVPLVHTGVAIGVFAVNSFNKDAYTDYHLNLIENIATYLTIAVLNSHAYLELNDAKRKITDQREIYKSNYENVKILSEIGADIASNLSLDSIIERVYKNVNELLPAESFSFGVFNPITRTLDFHVGVEKGIRGGNYSYSIDSDQDRLAVKCFHKKGTVLTNNLHQDYPNYPPAVHGEIPDSVIYVPLISKNSVIGAVNVSSFQKDAYTGYHVSVLQNLSVFISIAVENAKAYEQIDKSLSQLRELDEFKESMTAMIVHDFKNSLNTVINFSEGKPTERRMQGIRQAGQFMLNMVMNILDVQKFEETSPNLSLANYPVSRLLKHGVRQLTYMMEQKSIELNVQQDKAYEVRIDHDLIVRVIVNILSNAIKYSPQNGTVSIFIASSNGQVEVAIKDEGPGIPEDKLQTIFDKYSQVEARKEGVARSTGIGLTFCKMVIEAHKGSIWAESSENRGSEFFFTLPLLKELENERKESLEWKLDQMVELTAEERKSLDVHLAILSGLEVYDYSDVMDVLKKIETESENVRNWKTQLTKALQNGNEDSFKSLINH